MPDPKRLITRSITACNREGLTDLQALRLIGLIVAYLMSDIPASGTSVDAWIGELSGEVTTRMYATRTRLRHQERQK